MSRPGLNLIDAYVGGLQEAVRTDLATMASKTPLLTYRASQRLPWHDEDIDSSRERLFAVVVAGAIGGRPAQGLPRSVARRALLLGFAMRFSRRL